MKNNTKINAIMRIYLKFTFEIDIIPVFTVTKDMYKQKTGWIIDFLIFELHWFNGIDSFKIDK